MNELKMNIEIKQLEPWQEYIGTFHSTVIIDDLPVVVFCYQDKLVGLRVSITDFNNFKMKLMKNLRIGILRTDIEYRLRIIKEHHGQL